jgi:hypothetical protein
MKLDSLRRRIEALEPEGGICPHCQALEAISEEDLDVRIQALRLVRACWRICLIQAPLAHVARRLRPCPRKSLMLSWPGLMRSCGMR